jgi:hypothetical protein
MQKLLRFAYTGIATRATPPINGPAEINLPGYLKMDSVMASQGLFLYANGDKYRGEFKHRKREGTGVY